jgi:CRP-like cAMP-binding protein
MKDQAQPSAVQDARRNQFLARLEQDDFEALMRVGKTVTFKLRKRILLQDGLVDAVYFPMTCMFSLLVTLRDKPEMEMATIGKEGLVGAWEVLQGQPSMGLNIIQIPGTAIRIPAASFREVVRNRPSIQRLMHQHLYALLRQILYGAGCNRKHSMEERCVRWLLMTHDRAGEDTFPLTQEFLSHMLGVRRATVNVATGMLRKAGFIQYVRGKVTVLDRAGLESASCDCYRAINRVYDSAIPAPSANE